MKLSVLHCAALPYNIVGICERVLIDVSNVLDMVLHSESKSRRWKSHNTPNMSAPSAENKP